jgi:polynucleotide 5'-kinase involved in rRNA processing
LLLYKTLITELAKVVKKKCKQQIAANVGGVVINTCGWVKGEG